MTGAAEHTTEQMTEHDAAHVGTVRAALELLDLAVARRVAARIEHPDLRGVMLARVDTAHSEASAQLDLKAYHGGTMYLIPHRRALVTDPEGLGRSIALPFSCYRPVTVAFVREQIGLFARVCRGADDKGVLNDDAAEALDLLRARHQEFVEAGPMYDEPYALRHAKPDLMEDLLGNGEWDVLTWHVRYFTKVSLADAREKLRGYQAKYLAHGYVVPATLILETLRDALDALIDCEAELIEDEDEDEDEYGYEYTPEFEACLSELDALEAKLHHQE